MRSVCVYILVSVAASVVALADPVPVDPQILIDSGGDAPDINYTGVPITIGPKGGGIFVFHNATGNALNEIDVNVDFPEDPLPTGFTVQGTIPVPPSLVRQFPNFQSSTFPGFTCAGVASTSDTCVDLKFILNPGPLIPINANFVLDFNNSANYTADDIAVEDGTYTGGDLPDGTGGWAPGAMGGVDPIPPVPEPSYRATAGLMGLAILAAWNLRHRLSTAKKS
jgi:hypothetical protein